MKQTLTRNERLKKGNFRGIKWTKYGETTHFVVRVKENRLSLKRIGASIGKKTGNAVRRNRMRRLIKEFFRLHKPLFGENTDILIVVKSIPDKPTLHSVGEELKSALPRPEAL